MLEESDNLGCCMDDCLESVRVYTDGACKGNPGAGGWGVYIDFGRDDKALSGPMPDFPSTNQRAEVYAIIQALAYLREQRVDGIKLYTDSKYALSLVGKGSPRSNADLHAKLNGFVDCFNDLELIWVKGHNGDPGNEKADQLAVAGAQEALEKNGTFGLVPEALQVAAAKHGVEVVAKSASHMHLLRPGKSPLNYYPTTGTLCGGEYGTQKGVSPEEAVNYARGANG